MAFTFTRKHKALPAARSGSTALARPSGGGLNKYKEAAKGIFRRGTGAAKGAVSAAKGRSAAYSAALARAGQTDTLGGIFARQVGPGIAAGGAGVIDGSVWGKAFEKKLGGWMKPATALFLLGGVARGFNLDRRFLGRHLTRGNTHLLTGMTPVLMYRAGERIPAELAKRFGSGASKPASLSGAGDAGALSQGEPVPGEEATVS